MSGRYGYANGDTSDRQNTFYESENASSGSVNGYRDRRAGGYGGLTDSAPRVNNTSPARVRGRNNDGYEGGDWRRRRADEEYSDSSRSRERGLNGVNGNGRYETPAPRGGQRMEGRSIFACCYPSVHMAKLRWADVLQYINSEWPFMGGDDCVPVKVGLQLMDDSSLGLAPREQEFQQTYDDLQRSLKAIVNGMHSSNVSGRLLTRYRTSSGFQQLDRYLP